MQEKNYQKTITNLEHALKAFPDDPKFHFALAIAHFREENFPQAWHHGRKAQSLGMPDVESFLAILREVSEEPPEEIA
ncbi:MAG: tetratricopeptide repeat protein [Pseudomonadota bacterium]